MEQICKQCSGYKVTPMYWNSTIAPSMCSCPKPAILLGTLAWECSRCHKINAPWKGSCDCNPPSNSSPTCYPQQYTAGKNNFNQTYVS